VRDPEFSDVLGSSPEIHELVKTNAHEGGVWYPDKNEFYFTSTLLTGSTGDARAVVDILAIVFIYFAWADIFYARIEGRCKNLCSSWN